MKFKNFFFFLFTTLFNEYNFQLLNSEILKREKYVKELVVLAEDLFENHCNKAMTCDQCTVFSCSKYLTNLECETNFKVKNCNYCKKKRNETYKRFVCCNTSPFIIYN